LQRKRHKRRIGKYFPPWVDGWVTSVQRGRSRRTVGRGGLGLGSELPVLDVVLQRGVEQGDARVALDVDAHLLHLGDAVGEVRESLHQHGRGLIDELALRELHHLDHPLLDQGAGQHGHLLDDRVAEAGTAQRSVDIVDQDHAGHTDDDTILLELLLELDHARIVAADADGDPVRDGRIERAAQDDLGFEVYGRRALVPGPAHGVLRRQPALVHPREHLLQLALAVLAEGGVHEGELDLVADGLPDPRGLSGDVDHRGQVGVDDLDAPHEDGRELLLDDLIVERELDGPLPRVDVAGLGRGFDHVPHQGDLERLVTEHLSQNERRPEGLEGCLSHFLLPILNRQRVDSRRFTQNAGFP
jgi:hypothetical protein